MIGTIRKHSSWLWWIIAGLTVISFVYWGVAPATRNNGAAGGEYGTIYGHRVTADEWENAKHDFFLYYWFRNGEWPNNVPNIKEQELEQQIYLRLLFSLKAQNLGIHIGDDATFAYANVLLHSSEATRALGTRQPTVEMFVSQILAQEGLTADDFERYSRSDLAVQQLLQAEGMAGQLITPQEAAGIYQRYHQEVSAQVVFFSASNYLSQTVVLPPFVGQFYTNNMAYYRLPDRVQVNYVDFNVTNFLAQAQAELTNLDYIVQANYTRLGPDGIPDAKTPEEAKARIRESLLRQRALADARQQANDFATAVFNQTNVQPENLVSSAKQKGLAVHPTAPFDAQYGPTEFLAPETFVKAAFALTPENPFGGPVIGPTGVYVMALDKVLPAEIPPLDRIHDRVTHDFQMQQALAMAQRAGTNFAATLHAQLAAGHRFATTCVASLLRPELLPPFSLSTESLPELNDRAGLPQIKQAAFSTPPGSAGNFEPTDDGGFIVFVEKMLPFDQTAMRTDLPEYLASLRRSREGEVFNQWVNSEVTREMGGISAFQRQPGAQ